ncbi:MAG: NADP-dependent isocitrate dehydrogenase [Sulfurovum sp.]|nr:NADP-dependent isocitrate dehydrogenase [Sulfurovum sp.]MCB4748606.1 NADP-dependent isocitrate dehydrogenase [Sulfurovum sp.]MCB4754716.1 NADP-dependent isocitrate dehydrogenase [Sulfurovum sp.]MCB4758776.1 NADP-dependent isocitrate dehydrogenase [Sulfurovum sp.]MCB4765580.1 NADP-dependent isocitrate dehydrogenase [Sulfurovum sp.]
MSKPTIIWSKIDEAPALATYSLLPIVEKFTNAVGVDVKQSDISLAARVLAAMGLAEDELAKLGELVVKPEANIIKLPNISASVGQLKECIAELQSQGFSIPDYPENPETAEEKEIQAKYSTCLGSAVNPVLREGNSDRRAASAVKKYAQNHPHRLKPFAENSKAYVAHMGGNGDFYGNEQSVTIEKAQTVTIMLNKKELKSIQAHDGEILDGTFMSAKALRAFIRKTIDEAKERGVIWSIHLKATMMKISDPIMFGHAFEVFFESVFTQYADLFQELEVNPNLGMADLEKKIAGHEKEAEIKAAFQAVIDSDSPRIAMVDSDKGTTNFNAPNDIIIDASMPVVVREGGKQWDRTGAADECVAVVPDSTYAMFHQEMVADCVKNGQFDVTTMGNVSNVGLMAQKAEEYGSHPTTFEIAEDGVVEVIGANGDVLMKHEVEAGDIWRMSRAKDIPIKDWVRLAVERARLTGNPAIFWLDKNRAHDVQMLRKVEKYLKEHDTTGLDIQVMDVTAATQYTNERVRAGKDTISVTGNVLRDHLTDMYPILELGTSAKMLSIVPLLAGGGLFETGAGGSAPKHVDQFLSEGHLRWDSLGEFLALAESLRMEYNKSNDSKIGILTEALDKANEGYLDNDKAPSRKCGEPDNKASHYWVARYWAEALSAQTVDTELAGKFTPVLDALVQNEEKILSELLAIEGSPKDIGGYYHPDDAKAKVAMRPSATLNAIIDAM